METIYVKIGAKQRDSLSTGKLEKSFLGKTIKGVEIKGLSFTMRTPSAYIEVTGNASSPSDLYDHFAEIARAKGYVLRGFNTNLKGVIEK